MEQTALDVLAQSAAVATTPTEAGPSAVLALMTQAVAKGVPVETMESLQKMYHAEQDRSAAREFADAMARFQSECPSIQKRKTSKRTGERDGSKFAFTYAGLDDIETDAGPAARANGFSWSWDSDIKDGLMVVTCTLTHRAGHARSARFANPMSSNLPVNEQQKYAAALTYARRQSLVQVLGLTTVDEDQEGAPEDMEKIGTEQEALLLALIEETATDLKRFLNHFKIDRLADLMAADYQRAINALEQKRKKA